MDKYIQGRLKQLGVSPAQAKRKAKSKKANDLKEELVMKIMNVQGGSKFGNFLKKVGRVGRRVGSVVGNVAKKGANLAVKAVTSKPGRKILKGLREMHKDDIDPRVHLVADALGAGRKTRRKKTKKPAKKKKVSDYQKFVKKLRKKGASMPEIYILWADYKQQMGM